MCTNEETKKRVRQRLDSLLLAVKVAQTVEGHRDTEGSDAVVEVLMEELMKLHSCYGEEKAVDCGDTCGCQEGEGWACQEEEPCPCPGGDMCDCGRKHDLPFGCALEEAKNGARIARKGWNGKNQYVFLAKELEFHTDADLSEFEEHGVFVHDALAIKTSVDQIQIGWLASQSDMLSNDWYIVE